jgi:hypothetical protein
MKTRAEGYLDLYEGFKLGALGAGSHKELKVVPEPKPEKPKPEPPPQVIITDFNKEGAGSWEGWLGSCRWNEEHVGVGKAECLFAARQLFNKGQKWGIAVDITFFPGPDAASKEVLRPGDTVRYVRAFNDRKEAKASFNELSNKIEKEGLKALGFTPKKIGRTVSTWRMVGMNV